MFNRLKLKAQSLLHFSCKNCKSIILRQDDIDQFISYESKDLGQLSCAYSSFSKLQQQLEFFVLRQESFSSALKVTYQQSLLTKYHPFFYMYMFVVQCEQCGFPLGVQIQTVNQNTLWMEGKVLVDVQKCSVIKQTRDDIARLIKTLKSRLAKKLEQANEQQQQQCQKINAHDKEKQVIQKLQRVNSKQKNGSQSFKSQCSRDYKQSLHFKAGFQTLQTTHPHTNYVSRAETIQQHQSNFQSYVVRNDENSKNGGSLDSRTMTVRSLKSVSLDKPNKPSRNLQVNADKSAVLLMNSQQKAQFQDMAIDQQQKGQISSSLLSLKNRIIKQSQNTHSHQAVLNLFTQINRIQALQSFVYRRVIGQFIEMNHLLTVIRKNVLKSFQEVV